MKKSDVMVADIPLYAMQQIHMAPPYKAGLYHCTNKSSKIIEYL